MKNRALNSLNKITKITTLTFAFALLAFLVIPVTRNSFNPTKSETTNNSAVSSTLEKIDITTDVYAASCSINSASVIAGGTKSITHSGFANGESIRIFGTLAQREVATTTDSTISNRNQTLTIPSNIPAGSYNIVVVTRFPVTSTTCSGGPFNVTAPPTSSGVGCVFSPTTVVPGATVGIIPNGFAITPIPVKLVGTTFGNVVNVGAIPRTGGSITIPNIAGAFEVRLETGIVGGDITCTGTLTVNNTAPPPTGTPTCVFSDGDANPQTINVGSQMGIITNGFTNNSIPVELVGVVYGNTTGIIGNIPQTGGSVAIPNIATTSYKVRLRTGPSTTDYVDCAGTLIVLTGGAGNITCQDADINNDGQVTQADLDAMGDPTLRRDINHDGTINALDNTALAQIITRGTCTVFGTPGTPGTGGVVECNSFINCVNTPGSEPSNFQGTAGTFLGKLVSEFLPLAIVFGGFLSVIMIVLSGIQFITSSGNPDNAAAARGRLTFSIIGFILLVLAYALTKLISQIFLKSGAGFSLLPMPTTYAFSLDDPNLFPPAANPNVGSLVTIILQVLISLAGVLSIVFIIIGGLKIVTASGDSKKLASAQSTILYAIIGLIVSILALTIVNFVQRFIGTSVTIF